MIYQNIEFFNVEEIFERSNGLQLSRIPEKIRKNLNDNAKTRAFMPAGCELRFKLKSEKARFVIRADMEIVWRTGICEVYFGEFFDKWYFIDERNTILEISYPQNLEKLKYLRKIKNMRYDPEIVRIILPHIIDVRILEIEGEFEIPSKNQVPEKKFIAYGSSITHGAFSIIPSYTYIARTAYLLGLDSINKGLGGGCHLEKEIADYIAERKDWDFAIFEIGVNMVNNFEIEEFENRVDYFVDKIVKENSNKYLFFIDIFPFYMDFNNEDKQKKFREILENKIKKVNRGNLIHISGFDLLKDLRGLTADIIHPSSQGFEEISHNLAKIISNYLKIF